MQNWADRLKDAKEAFDGTPESLAALKAAVDGYNAVTGESIAITDEASGALSMSTEELQRNADAWIANSKAQAAQELVNEAVRGQVEAEMALADAHDAVEKSQSAYNQAVRDGNEAMADFYEGQFYKAKQAEKEAQAAVDARAESVEKLNGQYERYTQEAMLASQATDDFRNAIEHGEGELSEFDRLVENTTGNADELAAEMSNAGIFAQDFAKVGADAFKLLYEQSGKDMSKVKANIDMLQAAGIDPKTLYVDDDGTIRDCEGRVIDLDNQKINDKSFSVTVLDWASGIIDSIRDKLNGLPSEKRIQITQNVSTIGSFFGAGGRASGGVSPEPIRRVPRHADGGIHGITASPTLTNIGWVGEAGAEAIIPLTNKRYVRPFAQAVASEMGGGQRQVVNNYSITLDYKAGDDAVKMARDLGRIMRASAMMEG